MAPKKEAKDTKKEVKEAVKEDMSFDFNTITNHVTVVFRGKKTKLTPQFKDYSRAKEAVEEFCRKQGWKG